MADNQVIAVVGATGMQGGGLVRAILADRASGMTVRALTRNVNSDKAKELARLGAQVVAADVHDVGSLKRAFAGAYGAFCVTFFLGTYVAGEGIRRSRGYGHRRQGGGRTARGLVDTGRHAPLGAPR